MKKAVLFILLVLLQFAVVNAQGRMSPKERVKDLKSKLELTDEQAQKIENIFTESQQKMKDYRDKNEGVSRTDMMKEMRAINENADKSIDSLLTDKQKEQYAAIKKERQERMNMRTRPQN